jgi:hypothetical protein
MKMLRFKVGSLGKALAIILGAKIAAVISSDIVNTAVIRTEIGNGTYRIDKSTRRINNR